MPLNSHETPNENVEELLEQAKQCLRKYVPRSRHEVHGIGFLNTFKGSECVDAFIDRGVVDSRESAILIGSMLLERNYLRHIFNDFGFEDADHLYRCTVDEDHGRVGFDDNNVPVSWSLIIQDCKVASRRNSGHEGLESPTSSLHANMVIKGDLKLQHSPAENPEVSIIMSFILSLLV